MQELIKPNWLAPSCIKAYSTTRLNGFSESPYDSFNLAKHVGDDEKDVEKNREHLKSILNLPAEPVWLNQQHTGIVIDADHSDSIDADGAYSQQKNIVCAVMTADCLPILLCNKEGTEIAALHAGWKGLTNNIIENGIEKFQSPRDQILAWLGPAIGPNAFEVGDDVKDPFIQLHPDAKKAFKKSVNNQWLMDIYLIASQRLKLCGIHRIFTQNFCTFSDPELFFSYRRDHQTGRMANLIWIAS